MGVDVEGEAASDRKREDGEKKTKKGGSEGGDEQSRGQSKIE